MLSLFIWFLIFYPIKISYFLAQFLYRAKAVTNIFFYATEMGYELFIITSQKLPLSIFHRSTMKLFFVFGNQKNLTGINKTNFLHHYFSDNYKLHHSHKSQLLFTIIFSLPLKAVLCNTNFLKTFHRYITCSACSEYFFIFHERKKFQFHIGFVSVLHS